MRCEIKRKKEERKKKKNITRRRRVRGDSQREESEKRIGEKTEKVESRGGVERAR